VGGLAALPPRVGAGIAAAAGGDQPLQEMGPAEAVLGGFRGQQAGVGDGRGGATVPGVKMSSRVEVPVRHDEAILDHPPATRSYRYTIDGGLPVADNWDRLRSSPPAAAPRSSGSQLHGPGPGASFPTLRATQGNAERTTV
jgi:hypothetical protein